MHFQQLEEEDIGETTLPSRSSSGNSQPPTYDEVLQNNIETEAVDSVDSMSGQQLTVT